LKSESSANPANRIPAQHPLFYSLPRRFPEIRKKNKAGGGKKILGKALPNLISSFTKSRAGVESTMKSMIWIPW
jgi:hypothetical protein